MGRLTTALIVLLPRFRPTPDHEHRRDKCLCRMCAVVSCWLSPPDNNLSVSRRADPECRIHRVRSVPADPSRGAVFDTEGVPVCPHGAIVFCSPPIVSAGVCVWGGGGSLGRSHHDRLHTVRTAITRKLSPSRRRRQRCRCRRLHIFSLARADVSLLNTSSCCRRSRMARCFSAPILG